MTNNVMEEYQIFDCTDRLIVETVSNFEGAREYIAGYWSESPNDTYVQFDKIMATETLDELNKYAAGLGYIIERVE